MIEREPSQNGAHAAVRATFEKAQALHRAPRLTKMLRVPRALLLRRLASIGGCIRVKANLVCGQHMTVVLPDAVSAMLYTYGYFDAPVCHMMLDHVRPGQTVFDVGSHFGFFTLLAASLVGPSGQVHSFEPTPSTYEMVKANAAPFSNVRVNHAAVCDVEGTAEFSDFGVRHSAFNTLGRPRDEELAGRSNRITVPTLTLDAYCAKHGIAPDFLKIDAENAEPRILAGLVKTLQGGRPMALAVEAGQAGSLELLDFLEPLGFRMEIYEEYGAHRVSTDPRRDIVEQKDVLFVR